MRAKWSSANSSSEGEETVVFQYVLMGSVSLHTLEDSVSPTHASFPPKQKALLRPCLHTYYLRMRIVYVYKCICVCLSACKNGFECILDAIFVNLSCVSVNECVCSLIYFLHKKETEQRDPATLHFVINVM